MDDYDKKRKAYLACERKSVALGIISTIGIIVLALTFISFFFMLVLDSTCASMSCDGSVPAGPFEGVIGIVLIVLLLLVVLVPFFLSMAIKYSRESKAYHMEMLQTDESEEKAQPVNESVSARRRRLYNAWECKKCGRVNSLYVGTCACGNTLAENKDDNGT